MVDGGIGAAPTSSSPWLSARGRCCVGRTPLWGLAAAGEQGATEVLQLLREEIEVGLHLLGCASPADVTRAHVARSVGRDRGRYHRLPVSGDDDISVLARNAVHLLPEGGLDGEAEAAAPAASQARDRRHLPDIHVGRAIPLQRMRAFQDAGHVGVLIVGDYTTRIGDPSGRSAERPVLDTEEIDRNAQTYVEQAMIVLDRERTEVRFNSEWLGEPRLRGDPQADADDHRLADPRAGRLREAVRARASRSRCRSCCTR